MKSVLKILVVILVSLWIVTQSGCESEPEKENPQDVIKKTWSLGANGYVKKGNVNVSADYSNLSMTFNADGTCLINGGGMLFHNSNTWSWNSADTKMFTINFAGGSLPVEVLAIDNSTLNIRFDLQADDVNTNGKISSTVGSYEILLTEK